MAVDLGAASSGFLQGFQLIQGLEDRERRQSFEDEERAFIRLQRTQQQEFGQLAGDLLGGTAGGAFPKSPSLPDPGKRGNADQQRLARMGAMDPDRTFKLMKLLNSGEARSIEAARRQAQRSSRIAATVLKVRDKDPQVQFRKRQQLALEGLKQGVSTGAMSPQDAIAQGNQLLELGPQELENKMLVERGMGDDFLALSKPVERFEPVLDTAGKVIAQRSSTTGKEIAPGRREAKGAQSPIGKAREDLKAGRITQADFDTIKGTRKSLQSKVGKLIGDKLIVDETFGPESVQAQAINEAISSESKGEKPKLTDVAGIRKEFTKLSGDFIKIRDAIGKVEQATANPSGPGDIALIFNFMKILDPGSTVREGEFATAQNSAGVTEKFRALFNRVQRGERLSEKQRGEFAATAGQLFKSQTGKQLELETEFQGIAERANITPADVVIDFMGEGRPGAPEIINFDAQGNIIQ